MIIASRRIVLGLAAGLGLTTGQASAGGVIYDNLPTETYVTSGGYGIFGSSAVFRGPYSHSESFVARATADLGDIKVAVWYEGVYTSDFTLTLTDSKSSVLETWTADAPASIASAIPVVEVDSVLHPLLLQGQTYTLTASPASPTTLDSWEDQSDTYTNGKSGFRVEGAAVPEPGALTSAGTAALIGLACARRRRKAIA